jgi:CheY-like chemotaxis protein
MTRTVLVVDDEADVRAIAQLGLEMGAGWTVLTASCGSEALAIAATQAPDVILLDLMMPGLDGRGTLQALKANPTTRAIPVILVTAKVQPSQTAELAQLEVADVFAKPFRPLQLAQQIQAALGWA